MKTQHHYDAADHGNFGDLFDICQKYHRGNPRNLSGENRDTKERGVTRHRSNSDAVTPLEASGNPEVTQRISSAQTINKRNRGKGKPFAPRPLAWIKEGDCIRCISHKGNKDGYIVVLRDGHVSKLSRLILSRRYKSFSKELISRHTCDHPWCINPNHLIPGTYADNNRDRSDRGRTARIFGEKNHSSKLTNALIIIIRDRLSKGDSQRSIAKDYRVTHQCIGLIERRVNWKHI